MDNKDRSDWNDLLIESCRYERDARKLESFAGKISDWTAFLDFSNSHGVYPLIAKALKPVASVPQRIKSILKFTNLDVARRNMAMTAELLQIMKMFKDNDIPALAFKGPVLSQMIHGDITQRQYVDVDILVNVKYLYKAAELMVDRNYEPMDSIEFLKNDAKLNVEKNYEFSNKKNNIKVEIHWRLINVPFLKKFKYYDVFSSSQEISINQTCISTLDIKILLLYLCNHGIAHMWERLEWIVDIDRLITSEADSLNWEEILTLATTLQSKTTLLLGLGLSRELFGTRLPSNILSLLDSRRIKSLVAFVLKTLDSDLRTKDHTSHKKNLAIFQFYFALQDSFSIKIGFLVNTVFSYNNWDVMTVNLPKRLFFLYYPLRLLRLMNKYTLEPLQFLFTKKTKRLD
jgi:hypothetical protein